MSAPPDEGAHADLREAPEEAGARAARGGEATRAALLDAALTVFAEGGFERGSVRRIAGLAGANVAMVAYHYGSKEGLYRAALESALGALDAGVRFDEGALAAMDRAEALRRVLRRQLRPLARGGAIARAVRLIGHETTSRTAVFEAVLAEGGVAVIEEAGALVERFLPPGTTPEARALVALWLLNQAFVFVRSHDHLARPPWNLAVDEAMVDRLADLLARLVLGGLEGFSREGGATPAG